jgi:hypothetical protein
MQAGMAIWPAIGVLGTTVAIGLYMGWRHLKGRRNDRVLIGFHLLLGVAGLEVTAILVRGHFTGGVAPPGSPGRYAAVLFAVAMFSGLIVPLLAPRWPRGITPMLWGHAAIGLAGFIALLAWGIGG